MSYEWRVPREMSADSSFTPSVSRSSLLNELDRIAVGVGDPGGAKPAGEEVVRRAEGADVLRGQAPIRTVDVVGPEHDLDEPAAELWAEAVVGDRRLDGGESELELVEGQLDV